MIPRDILDLLVWLGVFVGFFFVDRPDPLMLPGGRDFCRCCSRSSGRYAPGSGHSRCRRLAPSG